MYSTGQCLFCRLSVSEEKWGRRGNFRVDRYFDAVQIISSLTGMRGGHLTVHGGTCLPVLLQNFHGESKD